jgi:hypothetical protein
MSSFWSDDYRKAGHGLLTRAETWDKWEHLAGSAFGVVFFSLIALLVFRRSEFASIVVGESLTLAIGVGIELVQGWQRYAITKGFEAMQETHEQFGSRVIPLSMILDSCERLKAECPDGFSVLDLCADLLGIMLASLALIVF